MDKKAAGKLWGLLEQKFPDYRLKNRLVVRVPLGNILCGVLFESSAFSKGAFCVDIFVQPLYVPSEHLVLTFGMRVPGQWEYDASVVDELAPRVLRAVRDQALPFHQTHSTPDLFYRHIT